MLLKIISSGSSGNGYAIMNDNEILLIEAGISVSDIKKAIDFKTSKIVDCLIGCMIFPKFHRRTL